MRTIILAASLLATLAAPAFAHSRHHVNTPANASEFVGVVPTDGGSRIDRSSPRLNDGSNHCAWTAACGY